MPHNYGHRDPPHETRLDSLVRVIRRRFFTLVSPRGRRDERVYFGMYGKAADDGIYVAELDLGSGVVTAPRLAARAVDPSFLAFDPCTSFSTPFPRS